MYLLFLQSSNQYQARFCVQISSNFLKGLIKKINQGFRTLYKNGEFQKISDKWFGEDVATDQVKGKK